MESALRKRQMEDFRGIVDRFLGQTEDSGFPLAAWLKLEPHLLARRYVFVKSGRELLEQAEEVYTAILAEREAERVRAERQKEQDRKRKEEERLRVEREKERDRQEREQQAAREREATRQREAAEAERSKHEAAWNRADKANNADALEEYLKAYPSGQHADEARERATEQLRRLLLRNRGNPAIRKRYLEFRTEELVESDEKSACGWRLLLLGAILGGLVTSLSLVVATLGHEEESSLSELTSGVIFSGVALTLSGVILAVILMAYNDLDSDFSGDRGTILLVLGTVLLSAWIFLLGSRGNGVQIREWEKDGWTTFSIVPMITLLQALVGSVLGAIVGSLTRLTYRYANQGLGVGLCALMAGLTVLLASPIGLGLGWMEGRQRFSPWLLVFVAVGTLSGCLWGLSLMAICKMIDRNDRVRLAGEFGPIPWYIWFHNNWALKRLRSD